MPTDLREVAKLSQPSLKVSSESKPQSVARAIQHVMREASTAPSVTAIGPAAINQAVKAIAIARRQAHAEGTADITVKPIFGSGLRDGSNVALVLDKAEARVSEAAADDESALSAKASTDAFKLAGAIAGRMRESQRASILVKGPVPVLVAVKAIAKAQEYVANDFNLAFTAALVDRENKDLRNAPTSTFTQFSILALPSAAKAA